MSSNSIEAPQQERFFYHCFPRQREGRIPKETGLKILELMCKNGFLLLAEQMEWSDPKDSEGELPWKGVSIRMSFTELELSMLPDHMNKFGSFALELTTHSMLNLGGLPVSYMPTYSRGNDIIPDMFAMSRILLALKESMDMAKTSRLPFLAKGSMQFREYSHEERLVIQDFVKSLFGGDGEKFRPIFSSFTRLMNLWYPLDRGRLHPSEATLDYYKQKEWRIIIPSHHPLPVGMSFMNESLGNELLSLDHDFFSKPVPVLQNLPLYTSGLYIKLIEGRHVMSFIQRILVPDECQAEAKAILAHYGFDAVLVVSEREASSGANLAS